MISFERPTLASVWHTVRDASTYLYTNWTKVLNTVTMVCIVAASILAYLGGQYLCAFLAGVAVISFTVILLTNEVSKNFARSPAAAAEAARKTAEAKVEELIRKNQQLEAYIRMLQRAFASVKVPL